MLERVIRGIRRFHGDVERKERLSITHPILEKIIAALSGPILPSGISKELAETLKSAYSLSFAGFFRCGEVTYDVFDPAFNLKRRDVIIQSNDYLTVDLPGSKTDPFRKGVRITIARTGLSTCAYTHLVAHLAAGQLLGRAWSVYPIWTANALAAGPPTASSFTSTPSPM